MKFFHLSDLHIGKQLHFYDLLEDQRHILSQIVTLAAEHHPDAIVIAGDIYDRSVPSGEAQELFDHFLTQLAAIRPNIPVLLIAGNHDGAKRLAYAAGFLRQHDITIRTMPPQTGEEHLERIVLQDEYGPVTFWLLPYTRPGMLRRLLPEETITDTDAAVAALLARETIDLSQRNVLVAHQFFVAGGTVPATTDSEWKYLSVGGLDRVDTSKVSQFDYVALGHLHGAQRIGADYIRYCGTPLKYSVSEEHQEKGVLLVTLGAKGEPPVWEQLSLVPLHEVRSLRGTLAEVIGMAETCGEDYVSITLTDEDLYRPKDVLDAYYARILEVRVDNARTRAQLQTPQEAQGEPDPVKAFAAFYEEMNGQPMSAAEEAVIRELWGDYGTRTE